MILMNGLKNKMDIHESGSENSSGKEDNFVKFLDNITSNSLMDYKNWKTKNTTTASDSTRNVRCYPATVIIKYI